MIREHPSFRWPPDETKLWRYMDLGKFASLMFSKRLYFSKASNLGDPFEFSKTFAERKMAEYILANRHSDPRLAQWIGIPEVVVKDEVGGPWRRELRDQVYVNCWHAANHESAAMWRLYSKADESICIQSTFGRLKFELPEFIHAGLVQYLDYDNAVIPRGNIFNYIISKRHSFEHERELRAAACIHPTVDQANLKGCTLEKDGLTVPVVLKALIEQVVVSPFSQSWFLEVVGNLCSQCGLALPVRQSDLAREPIF